jgi:signal transduction histidine kinase
MSLIPPRRQDYRLQLSSELTTSQMHLAKTNFTPDFAIPDLPRTDLPCTDLPRTDSTRIDLTRTRSPELPQSLMAAPIELPELVVCQKPVAASLCFTLDAQGTILAVNLPGAIALGYAVETLVGTPLANLLHLQDRPRWHQEFQAFWGQQARPSSFRLVRQDGSITHQSMTAQVLQGVGQPVMLWVSAEAQPLQAVPFSCSPERERVAEVLRLQSEWKRLMAAIARPVRQSLPLKQVLKATAQEVLHILQADRVWVYRFHPNTAGSITTEVFKPGISGIRRQPMSAAICYQKSRMLPHLDRVSATPSPQPIPDLARSPWLNSLHQLGATAEIVVPIVSQPEDFDDMLSEDREQAAPELWGLLIVQQCQTQRYWKDWELELLNQLVTHLGIVVQQAELNQRAQRWNANLERQIRARTSQLRHAYTFEATLKRITDEVRDSLEEDQILQAVLQELARAIGLKCCNASLYDLEQGTSTVHYEYTHSLSPYQGRVVNMAGSPEIYSQLIRGQAFQFCSLTPNQERGRVVMLACPMMDDQGVVGDLWLINQPDYRFTEQDIRLVQQVANQCAIAIRQARLYQAAQAQVKELERLNQLKDDFLSTVSHELRTPMANIKLAIQMLEMVLKPSGLLENASRAGQYFRILQSECRREIGLINDLLDLSRIEDGSETLSLAQVELTTWIPALIQPFLERAQSHQQRLILALDPALSPLTTDSSHLERVITELLQNACKYTPAGETISITAEESAHTEAGLTQRMIALSVCNTGVEIPLEERSRVFEKFYRIPNGDPWQHGGTGLGLALVKKLATHLGGSLTLSCGADYTCFRLELPLKTENSEFSREIIEKTPTILVPAG